MDKENLKTVKQILRNFSRIGILAREKGYVTIQEIIQHCNLSPEQATYYADSIAEFIEDFKRVPYGLKLKWAAQP